MGSQSYFTSDTHFGHANVIRYSNRPFADKHEMDAALIYNWNKKVKPDDYVYSQGDFAFGNIEYIVGILRQLNGQHHMILGNHDKVIIKNRQMLLDEGLVKSIESYREIYVNNQFICLFHYPMQQFNKCHHGAWALHGHCHGSVVANGRNVDVGVDAPFITGAATYTPYSFYQIKDFMATREDIAHH